jgi:hypothetical protein
MVDAVLDERMRNKPEFMTHERIMTGEEYVSYSDYLALQEERDTALAALSQGGGKTLTSKWLEAIKERDEARHEIEGWKNKWNIAVEMAARAENESEEQARLLGMSAEREESLRGKLFLAERELSKIREAAKSVVEIWETPPWKIDATPSKAITQLRDAIGQED